MQGPVDPRVYKFWNYTDDPQKMALTIINIDDSNEGTQHIVFMPLASCAEALYGLCSFLKNNISLSLYLQTYICTYTNKQTHVCAHTPTYIHLCICIYTHTYINTHTDKLMPKNIHKNSKHVHKYKQIKCI